MKRRLYIQLGRAGDILNILPLCKCDFDRTGTRPVLMVAEAFETLLEGVSYVEPLIVRDDFKKIVPATLRAAIFADGNNSEIVCTQIYGEGLWTTQDCSSFCRESWARLPDAPAWGSLSLVFDRRDPAREEAVKGTLLARSTGKPYVVLALSGTSSPFEHGPALARQLRENVGGQFDIVDISGFIAPRFFDLLGLLEGARALVTIDAGVLHLAAAVPSLPVVAFVTREPTPWHGTPWRPQHVRRFYYDEAPECFDKVAEGVLWAQRSELILHAYTFIGNTAPEETLRRNAFAASTWRHEYASGPWIARPFTDEDMERSSVDAPILDERPIPFMHDVINSAFDNFEPRDSDIIAWTNADSCFVPGITGLIYDAVRRHGAAYTHRWDFHHPLTIPFANEAEIRRGEWYPGTDACFFTVKWWRDHAHEYPDMLVGREQNDEVLRQLIKARGGCEIPAAIYHEKHASYWEHHGRRTIGPGNLYNQRLAKAWFRKMGFREFDPVWWQLHPEPAQRAWVEKHVKERGPA